MSNFISGVYEHGGRNDGNLAFSGESTDCSNIVFYICELNVVVVADNAVFEDVSGKNIAPVDAVAAFDLSAQLFRDAYTVCADSADIGESDPTTDLSYVVNPASTALMTEIGAQLDALYDIDIVKDDVIGRAYSIDGSFTNTKIGDHYLRYLSHQMFSNKNLVDLYQNETGVRESIKDISNAKTNLVGPEGQDVAKELFRSMMAHDKACRLTDMSNVGLWTGVDGGKVGAPLPMIPGDKVVFNVTVKAAPENTQVTNGDLPIDNYEFRVVIDLK